VISVLRALGLATAVLLSIVACGGGASATPTPTPPPTAPAGAATQAADTPGASDGGAGQGSEGPAPSVESWSQTASELRGKDGSRYTFTCTPNGTLQSIWGTDTYTDDSSICTAAVHAGLITLAAGGTVTIEIRPGQDSYTGSDRNGVTSNDYGTWGGSYVLVGH
jgi:hypothetical protein